MNYDALITAISDAHRQAQTGAAGAVNRHLILRNWLVGAYLVEFEQNGEDRAQYGAGLIPRVALDLKSRDIGGLGTSMLKSCRTFYRLYPQIRQSVIGELPVADAPEICAPGQFHCYTTNNGRPLQSETRVCETENHELPTMLRMVFDQMQNWLN